MIMFEHLFCNILSNFFADFDGNMCEDTSIGNFFFGETNIGRWETKGHAIWAFGKAPLTPNHIRTLLILVSV